MECLRHFLTLDRVYKTLSDPGYLNCKKKIRAVGSRVTIVHFSQKGIEYLFVLHKVSTALLCSVERPAVALLPCLLPTSLAARHCSPGEEICKRI